MSAHVLLNSLNELRKSDKMQGLPSILLLFCNGFNKFNNVSFYLSFDIKITLKSHFWCKKFVIMCTTLLWTSFHVTKICKPLVVY